MSTLLDEINLSNLMAQHYDFDLSRPLPDSGQRQIFASEAQSSLENALSFDIQVPNGRWTLRMAYQEAPFPFWLKVVRFGLVVSFSAVLSLALYGRLRNARQRRWADQDLRASEVRFRVLCAAVPIRIYQADGDGLCTYTNNKWTEITGLTAEDSLGDG